MIIIGERILESERLSQRINNELGWAIKKSHSNNLKFFSYILKMIFILFILVFLMIAITISASAKEAENAPVLIKPGLIQPIQISLVAKPNISEEEYPKTLSQINTKIACNFMANSEALANNANPEMVSGYCYITDNKFKMYIAEQQNPAHTPQAIQESDCAKICRSLSFKKLFSD